MIDEQVINALMNLKPPAGWKAKVVQALANSLGEKCLQQRLDELTATIQRLDLRWDEGFITDKNEFVEKRRQLQQELDSLTPLAEDNSLEVAADMLENFTVHWQGCGDDIEKQHELIKGVVERVYVRDDEVVAMTLKADYHIVLNELFAPERIVETEA
jgi:hypothetical protein